MIPTSRASEEHDHVIVPKEPIPTAEHKEQYGHAYENERKKAIKGDRKSPGLAPKLPGGQKLHQPITQPHSMNRKTCNTYGQTNRCEGMTCETDDQCASQCCGQLGEEGFLTCHALIEDSFCPRAVAPKIDYSMFKDHDDMPRRNDMLRTMPSNEMPTYRGQDGCKVHGTSDQCDG